MIYSHSTRRCVLYSVPVFGMRGGHVVGKSDRWVFFWVLWFPPLRLTKYKDHTNANIGANESAL